VPIVVQYNKRDLPTAAPLDECDKFGQPAIHEACAKAGEGVVPTFFALVERAWAHLERDLQLSTKLGIDAQTFRKQLAEHVGATEANS